MWRWSACVLVSVVSVIVVALALAITVVSACCLNLGYLLQHSVVSKQPALSLRRPAGRLAEIAAGRDQHADLRLLALDNPG